MGKSNECVIPPYGTRLSPLPWRWGDTLLTFVRKNKMRFDGSRGIFPETVNGRTFAPARSVRHALRAASHSRSEDTFRLRGDEVADGLLGMCSTSKLTLVGLPGKGRPSERGLDVLDMVDERELGVGIDNMVLS